MNTRIRENLNAVYNASFWSELILKSHASGAEFADVFSLYTKSLALLDSENSSGLTITNHFLYRFLRSSGFITDFSECDHCGRSIDSGWLSFSPAEGGFLCSSCASAGLPKIQYSSAVYLEESASMLLEEAVGKRLDLQSEKEIRNMMLAVLKSIIDTPLNTLDYIDYGME